MTAELGGPVPREGMGEKVRRDAGDAAADVGWFTAVIPAGAGPDAVAGLVILVTRDHGSHGRISEIGWMELPEFRGRGLARRATRTLLERARDDGGWGRVHAFPATPNGPSNGVCRGLGCTLVGRTEGTFGDRVLHSNQWMIDRGTAAFSGPPAEVS
ncbi:GNAT family N-acetyltransferase [Streptomyces sp. JJ38]|uniref:GNAT family N-acetyltransferase n=1 Tax=Streptomyces sp. JJ38 TaxID=2738128 RepID=UPI0027D773DC|nr:GNAT family protein [Streptomyces sp. JJ38]